MSQIWWLRSFSEQGGGVWNAGGGGGKNERGGDELYLLVKADSVMVSWFYQIYSNKCHNIFAKHFSI